MQRRIVWCKFCGDRGCIACPGERAKKEVAMRAEREALEAQAATMPLPDPLFVAHFDNPAEMAALKDVFHREVIEQAFGPNGGGITEIIRRAVEAKRKLAEDTGEAQP